MHPIIGSKLRVECRANDPALPNKHGLSVQACKHFDILTNPFDLRCSYKHRFEGSAIKSVFGFGDETIDLPPVCITFNDYIDQPKRSLRRIIHLSRQDNSSRAGAEDRFASASKVENRAFEAFLLDKLEHRRALATRQNETVYRAEIVRSPYFYRDRAGTSEGSRMGGEITLDGQHAD